MVCCGVVWWNGGNGVVWCSVVWCGVVCCDWCSVVWCGVVCCDVMVVEVVIALVVRGVVVVVRRFFTQIKMLYNINFQDFLNR